MTTTQILADLANDYDLTATIANLEATYFEPLSEAGDLNHITRVRLAKARDTLQLAMEALEKLVTAQQD